MKNGQKKLDDFGVFFLDFLMQNVDKWQNIQFSSIAADRRLKIPDKPE